MFATAYVACSILWSGFYIRVADMKVSVMRGLSWVSYTKYAMMGVSRVELQDRVYDTSACITSGNTGASQVCSLVLHGSPINSVPCWHEDDW